MSYTGYITEQDVREDMKDRSFEDHLLLPDVAFTPEDIAYAMKKAARKFNSIQPYVCTVEPHKLSARTNVFFDGIAWALLERWLLNASLNEMDYSAGNVTASTQGKLIGNLEKMVKNYREQFITVATEMKVSINLNNAFGEIG